MQGRMTAGSDEREFPTRLPNPVGIDGIEFVEYTTTRPQALGQVLETMGFRPVARHRSREVLRYRQGPMNVIVNAHPDDQPHGHGADAVPTIAAVALRVRDARAAYAYVLARGAWDVPVRTEVMELHIPAIRCAGGSRIYFVDRHREFSIYDVDFVPIPTVDPDPPAVAGMHYFGIVQYIGTGRTRDWILFYTELFGFETIPDDVRFGILPKGTLMRSPCGGFCIQLIETDPDAAEPDHGECLRRIGFGVPDVGAAIAALGRLGVDFVDTELIHPTARGALTRAYLGGVLFELVKDDRAEGDPVPMRSDPVPMRSDPASTRGEAAARDASTGG